MTVRIGFRHADSDWPAPKPHLAMACWWRWGRVELPVQNPSPGPTTSVSDAFRQPSGRPSAGSPSAHSRVPRSGLAPGYVTSPGLHLR